MAGVGVVEHGRHVVDGGGGHAVREQLEVEGRAVGCGEQRAQALVERGAVGDALGVARELRLPGQLGRAEPLAQPPELAVC